MIILIMAREDPNSLRDLEEMFRKGTFFIEKTETQEWLVSPGTLTNDPHLAKKFETEPKALRFMIEHDMKFNDGWEVTEHEFVD